MGKNILSGDDLLKMGYPQGKVIGVALNVMSKYYKRESKDFHVKMLKKVLENPKKYKEDEILGKIVRELTAEKKQKATVELVNGAVEFKVYGPSEIEEGAINQMETAMKLSVSVRGALMPDAHHGYGLPIGGVLAVENAVIPYGVGVDIGCRMCLSVYDLPVSLLDKNTSGLKKLLQDNTRFGTGSGFSKPMDDQIFQRDEFKEIKILKSLKDTAYQQIGSSGSGNHFVEFGVVVIEDPTNEFNLSPGKYLSILSHSGSRGLGANVAKHYTQLAMEKCILPGPAKHLAWLSLDSEEGQEYWAAMNLSGDYASACHHQIHRRLGKALGETPLAIVENHHNFAWKERLENGKEVIVHRKGATPAGKGVLGIIPGSMTAPGFIVRGKGNEDSLKSASHGAGRQMSRTRAKDQITHKDLRQELEKYGVELMGGGLDEAPMAYKDIRKVMNYQKDLVEVVGTFTPRIVRMDG